MICEKCNREIDSDSKFCKYCGCEISNYNFIEIIVTNIVIGNSFKITLKENSTYKELLNKIYTSKHIRFSKKNFRTLKIYDKKGEVCLRDNEQKFCEKPFNDDFLSDYFVNGCEILLYYEEDEPFNRKEMNFVCLYGCPMAKNIEINITQKDSKL